MRVGIVGCGMIGRKRAAALVGCRLIVCCDTDLSRAQTLGAEATTDWRDTVTRDDVDIVLVATTHDMLAPVASAAANAGKHVLIEKPGARRADELEQVAEASKRTGVLVRVGFNHRYHPAFRQARELFESGAIGDMLCIRGRYGHGGRIGYEREWRMKAAVSGGGELIDQGMHLIDLSRWFLGDFSKVQGHIATYFWDAQVEDNGFLLLTTDKGQAAILHASWTEWKNLFSFEIFGRTGKLEISGLGGSYGVERLVYYRMKPEMGPPETTTWEYPQSDDSWEVEFAQFVKDIELRREPNPGIRDAQAALRVIEQVYQSCCP